MTRKITSDIYEVPVVFVDHKMWQFSVAQTTRSAEAEHLGLDDAASSGDELADISLVVMGGSARMHVAKLSIQLKTVHFISDTNGHINIRRIVGGHVS